MLRRRGLPVPNRKLLRFVLMALIFSCLGLGLTMLGVLVLPIPVFVIKLIAELIVAVLLNFCKAHARR